MTDRDHSASSRVERLVAGGRPEIVLRTWRAAGVPKASLVLIHGYAEHSGRYEHVGARLAAKGIVVLAVDLRGHGLSGGERASVSDVAELVADATLARERAGAESAAPVFVFGHSMGGLVAIRLTLDRPGGLAGLVLSGPAVGDPSAMDPLLDLDPLPEIVLGSDLLASDPEVGRDYDADPLNYRGPFRRETLRMLANGARDVRSRWGGLELPLLVLHGGDDLIVPPVASEELHAGAASADKQLTVYPGLRHEILNEPSGGEIVGRIGDWIRSRA